MDDGVGIPDDIRSRLFSAFVTGKGEHGTGLGLWVSRSIVQRHGGTITIASNQNGSKGHYRVSLPAAKNGFAGERRTLPQPFRAEAP